MDKLSFRYGGGNHDIRSSFIRLCGWLQGKKTVLFNSNPKICGQVLAASDVKGTFVEHLVATPAWQPIYSIESIDGELWEQLAKGCRAVMGRIRWRERLSPLIQKYINLVVQQSKANSGWLFDAEGISRFVLRVMFELVFEKEISADDETLFYQASLELRKEIGVKGSSDQNIKQAFWNRLSQVVDASPLGDELLKRGGDREVWLSVFAQPFLISPQINVSDVMVSVFHFLRTQPGRLEEARSWAESKDQARLNGVLMEAIRLQHPFPILERELQQDLELEGQHLTAGTQVFILLDQFDQDPQFEPERWFQNPTDNPYASIPFGAGHRMCIGKPIAQILLVEFLQALLTKFPDAQIQPSQGHLYSGRDNDREQSFQEAAYQAKVFARALWESFSLGRRRKQPIGKCPWTGMKGWLSH